MIPQFGSNADSHAHSLQVLETLYRFDDFMLSVETVGDLGCGAGKDLEWWATRTQRDEKNTPLNIKCTGIDIKDNLNIAHDYANITYQKQDFEKDLMRKFDVLWCHNSFQYVIDVFGTLANWREALNENGMLAMSVPCNINLEYNKQAYDQADFSYYNWTLVSLIHVLAMSGFDCKDGFFIKHPLDTWIHAVVYRSEHEPMDPRNTTWYELGDKDLIPESAEQSAIKYGHVRQRDLVLPWLGSNPMSYADH